MRSKVDIVRMLLGGLCGTIGAVVTVLVLARHAHVAWLLPVSDLHTSPVRAALVCAVAAAQGFGLAWIYARTFDELLQGSALTRGLKFSVIAWLWVVAFAMIVRTAGIVTVPGGFHAIVEIAGVTAAAVLAECVTLALVYGAGRTYDEYTYGLGYGVPDRRSLG